MVQCPDKTCVRADDCCDGDHKCADGSCVSVFECCPDKYMCPDGSCVSGTECCDGERHCYGDDVCVAAEECCPAERRCDDGACVPGDGCCPDERPCEGGSCIAKEACCPEAPVPLCDPCEDVACSNGEWVCQGNDDPCCPAGIAMLCRPVPANVWPAPGGESFPLPAGCCPLTHYATDQPDGHSYCASPGGVGGTFWRCD
jgi:hypothetical protein